eukprot:160960_1
MSQSLSTHLHSTLVERPIRTQRSKCPSQLRSILIIIFIVLVCSLFFFDIEVMEMYWSPSPQQIIPIQSIYLPPISSTTSNSESDMSDNDIMKENNLLRNETEFNKLLLYYSKVSMNKYPSSWIHLNEQLFC